MLSEGDGPKVKKGDLLVADYLGEIYKSGKVFDNSYDRKQPAAFPIGAGGVIGGWDESLVGVNAGSRVLMVVPPKDGYGKKGNPDAGIKGTDSLVFVVDVIASYSKSGAGAEEHPGDGPPGRPAEGHRRQRRTAHHLGAGGHDAPEGADGDRPRRGHRRQGRQG